MGPIVLYDIVYLADRPDCVDACAAWAYGRWGVQMPDSSLERTQDYFAQCCQKDDLPLTLLAINRDTNLPVGMVSLWPQDGPGWSDKTPWISAVYTLYRYRGQRIAATLVERIQQEAKRLGFDKVHLQAGSAAEMYRKFGFREIDRRVTDTAAAGHEILFCKDV